MFLALFVVAGALGCLRCDAFVSRAPRNLARCVSPRTNTQKGLLQGNRKVDVAFRSTVKFATAASSASVSEKNVSTSSNPLTNLFTELVKILGSVLKFITGRGGSLRSDEELKKGIAKFYDESSGIWLDVWVRRWFYNECPWKLHGLL
jgi:hypothetical protein